jgi:site-specific DNA recombinase
MTVTRTAIYLRQSQDRQGTGTAVDRQLEACKRLCEERGWTVQHVLTDNDTSASATWRPDYAKLLELIRSGQVDVVVCWHIDRLTRKLTDLEHLIELCESTKVRVSTVTGDIDLSTDAGRLVGRILASVAKGEVERKSTRQKAANLQAAQAGKRPDKRAFGYKQDGSLDPVEAPIVEEAFSKFITGRSVTSITNWLNEKDVLTVRGNKWDRSSVRWMLMNLRYAGIRTYKGEEIGKGDWPAVVPEETVRAAIAVLNDPVRHKELPSRARKWLGARVYLCGRCASRNVESRMAVKYGSAGQRQYACQERDCWMVRKADPIDDLVKKVMVEYLREQDIGALMGEKSPDTAPLRTEAASLRKRIDQLAEDISLPESVLARRVAALEARLTVVQAQLAAAGRSSALWALVGAEDPGKAWLALVEPDVAAAQQVVRECFTVRLLPVKRGSRTFNPETVVFDKP